MDDYEQRILIVDDIDYNIEALKIILEYTTFIDASKICFKDYDGL